MKIKYIWHDNPYTKRIYDTSAGYEEHKHMCDFLHTPPMTKEEWNAFEEKRIAEKHAKGLVLSYEIIINDLMELRPDAGRIKR